MKGLFLTFTFALSVFISKTYAQCPPAGFPQPGNTCPTAPILCENLDGYCATINNNNVVQPFPGCPGWQLNNDEWFAFYAGTTSITIQITPSNCSPGNQMGLQGGIYAGCGPPWIAMDLQCSCTQNPFILSANNFVIGQIYWIVLDGCSGNVCDYAVDVLSGSTVGAPPNNPGPVTGPIEVCQGTTSSYSLAPVVGATIYTWSVTPAGIGTVTGNGVNANVAWGANASGPAQVCVTVANACYPNNTPSCIDVNVNPKPTAVISGGGVLCDGSSDPVNLTINFTGEAPWNFVYTINNVPQPSIQTSNNPYTLSVTQPGTYALQSVSSVVGNCIGTVSGSAVVTLTNIMATSAVTNATCGESNGAINLTINGGNTPYTFQWSGGQTTEDLNNIPAGSYTVTITDEDGCTRIRTIQVQDNPISFNISGNVTANTTCDGGNGSIDASVNPPGSYVYLWSNGANTQDISNLAPGTYTLTVTLGVNCTNTASFTVPDNPNTPNISATPTQSTCDLDNGSISLNVSGGVSPYTYIWSNGATTQNLTNIPAGSYTVTVTGANGCTSTTSATVSNNNPPIGVSANVVANTTCNSNYNGGINITVTPSGSYTFIWSNGVTTEDLTNLPPGTYSVTISAGGSCTQTANFTVPDNPNTPNITANPVQSTCDLSNGSINLSVSGGVSPYTFLWSNGATTQNISNIPAGSYSVTVTGANGCTNTANVTVSNNNPPINITATTTANTTCNGNSNGAINVTVTPAGSYTYIWSNGATTEDLTNLPPGTYTITISAGGSCTQTASFTVADNPNVPNVNANPIQSTCDLSNGSINLTVSGGVAPYAFLWSNGATTQNITNLPAGGYSVTVTGANGCSTSSFINVTNNNPPINVNATVTANTNCNGNGNGTINITVTPPANYTYIWSNGATTQNLTNLAPGAYSVTISAGGSCSQTAVFTVPDNPNAPTLSFAFTAATCGLSNGSINLSVTGGQPLYTYQWSSGQTTQDLSNIPGDQIYSVTVTGANGCSATDGVVLPDNDIPITLDGNVTPKTSCLVNNGAISLTLSPAGLAISWSNGATTPTISNLAPGTYTVTVSAGGTCTETATFVVENESEFPTLFPEVAPAFCNLPNGAIDLEVFDGQPPYTYKWSNGPTTQDLSNLLAGNYTVTVTTALGCSATTTVNVPNNVLAINVLGVVSDNTSCTTPNGFIDIDVDPPGNYIYKWSNGKTTQDIQDLAPGAYTVTVTLGSCNIITTFDVLNAAVSPNLSVVSTPAICGQSNGSASATASGGSAPYSFKWSNGAMTQNISNLAPGTYSVTATDFFFCSSTASVVVANNNIVLNISGITTENTSCVTTNGAVNISVSPAGNYTYLWSNSANTEDINNLAAGTYSVTVSAGSTCTATVSFTVTNNTTNPDISPAITPAICGNSNGAINLTISGAPSPFTFLWSNSATSEDIANIPGGNYSVTVTAANGCSADTILNVPNNSSTFNLTGAATPLTNCISANGAVDLTVTPAGPYTYLWSNGLTTQDISNLPAGIYSVSVTETGTCTASASFIVNDERTYPAATQTVASEICGLSNGSINLEVSGGETPYAFLWSNNATTEDLTNIPDGAYSVTITGANGCTTTTSANVPDNSVTFSITGTPTPNTSCVANNGGVQLDVSPADPGFGLSYTFAWSNGPTIQNLNNAPAGSYTVTVSAGGTCTNTALFVVPDGAMTPSISENVTPAFCGQNSGDIDLTISAGQPPYTFSWSNGQTNEDLNAVISGNYTVTVNGANGCSTNKTIIVPENTIIPSVSGTTTANTSCFANNGGVTLDVNPPLAYTFTWSNGQTSQNLTGVTGGSYSVTVNGGGACTTTASFNVPNDAAIPTVSGSVIDIPCFGENDGAIDVSINGGTQPYQFNWSPTIPGNPQNPSNLFAGNYSVTVTDALGCTGTAIFSVNQPPNSVQISCAMSANVTLPGATDGSGTVNILGGIAPYGVVWSPGGSDSNVLPGNFAINNLGIGAYAVTVTDANGCSATCNFNVSLINCQTAIGTMSSSLISLCGGGCVTANYNALGQFLDPNDVLQFILHEGSGNLIVNEIARNTQPVFCFDAAAMSYGTTYYISAVAGNNNGSGNVVLFDFCTEVSTGTPVIFREKPVATIAPPEPISCANEQVNVVGNSNLPGSAFSWSAISGNIVGNSNQATITADEAGLYTLIINLNGCSDTISTQVLDITNAPQATILANPGDVLDCTISQIILSGVAEGTTAANTVWLANGNVYATGTVLPIDAPGQYQFVILDTVTFCSDTAFILINENLAYPPLFLNPPGFLNCTNPVVTLTGGSPLNGIQFTWVTINGQDTTVIGTGTSLGVTAPGTYFIIGTDPTNHCINVLSTTVAADLNLPIADAGTTFSIECYGETANLTGSASGGTNLNFLWTTLDGNFVSGTTTLSPIINEPGTYFLLVTNPVNGCTDSDDVVISPKSPTAVAKVKQPLCYGDKGSILIDSLSGGKPPVLYSLNNGTFTTQNLFINLVPGTYSIVIQDANGCSTTLEAVVIAPIEFDIFVEPQAEIKLGDTYQINTQVNVPLDEIGQVNWTPPTGLSCDTCLNPLAMPLQSIKYWVTVVNKDGCEDRAPLLLIVDKRVDLYIPNVFSPDNDGYNDVFMIFADPRGVKSIKSMQVFTRWGELVFEKYNFEPNNPAHGWNGKHRNDDLNPGVFAWYAVIEFVDGSEEVLAGDVTIKR